MPASRSCSTPALMPFDLSLMSSSNDTAVSSNRPPVPAASTTSWRRAAMKASQRLLASTGAVAGSMSSRMALASGCSPQSKGREVSITDITSAAAVPSVCRALLKMTPSSSSSLISQPASSSAPSAWRMGSPTSGLQRSVDPAIRPNLGGCSPRSADPCGVEWRQLSRSLRSSTLRAIGPASVSDQQPGKEPPSESSP